MKSNPLNNKDFLLELDKHKERKVYARIIALNFNEQPIAQIEGLVVSGSINIDGTSAVRRSCSLSLVSNDFDINDYYWGLKSKFKLEIGLKNQIKDKQINDTQTWGDLYPQDIIWFPQGVYLITGFNTSQTTNNCSISISGKDKMCLLNGDLGGSLTASIDFGTEEYYDTETQETTYTNVPIETIIREGVHTYAQEPYYNIIINDLDNSGVELLEYQGDTYLYLFYNVKDGRYDNYTINSTMNIYNIKNKYKNGDEVALTPSQGEIIKLKECYDGTNYGAYLARVDLSDEYEKDYMTIFTLAADSDIYYAAAEVEYGQTVGYRQTDLTYAGSLISTIGESFTSILDKIKAMLGEFEYFYDLNGRFVFQKKPTYTQTAWNNLIEEDGLTYASNAKDTSAVTYCFEDSNMVTSFANNPTLNNLKNDYSIWGQKKSVSGAEIPIHYRYAIDVKPTYYVSLPIDVNDKYIIAHNQKLEKNGIKSLTAREKTLYCVKDYIPNATDGTEGISLIYRVDWREIIYQMALDYYKLGQLDDFINRLRENNPVLCQNYKTGYEQYYIDLQGFWRELYDINPQIEYEIISTPNDKEFVYKDEHGNIVENLYVKDKWVGLDEAEVKAKINNNTVDEIYGLKTVLEDETTRYELDSWINCITLNGNDTNFFVKIGGKIEKINESNIDEYLYLKKYFVYVESGLSENYESGISIYEWDLKYNHILKELRPGYHGFINVFDKGFFFVKKENDIPQKVTAEIVENAPEEKKNIIISLYKKDSKYFKYLLTTELNTWNGNINNDNQVLTPIVYYKEYCPYYLKESEYAYWAKDVYEQPDVLKFWFDFMDAESELGNFSIPAVGDRAKVINDTKITSIYFRETPSLIFTTWKDKDLYNNNSAYVSVLMSGALENMFNISSQGQSAHDKLDELLYANSYCIESVTVQSVPIYYLQPNTRIFIKDKKSGINGEYIVSKISLPLAYNGIMSITATKAPTRLY